MSYCTRSSVRTPPPRSSAPLARHTANTEGDNFVFAYSTNVVSNDPTTGTYTTMFWVNATSDQSYSFILPSSVAGKHVWIRAVDVDHTVGNTILDTLYVDQMNILAATPSGSTGVSLTNPGDSGRPGPSFAIRCPEPARPRDAAPRVPRRTRSMPLAPGM